MCVTVTPLPPKSVVSLVYTAFPQINQKILIADTCQWLELVAVILGFLKIFTSKETTTHFRTIIFSPKARFKSLSPTLEGLCVSFNAHHFFMWKQFMCVDDYTGRLILSSIILHIILLLASQAQIRKDKCVPEVVPYKWNLIAINYWREILRFIQELGPQVRLSSTIPVPNSKTCQGFHISTPLSRLRVICWLAHWIRVSPALHFLKNGISVFTLQKGVYQCSYYQ